MQAARKRVTITVSADLLRKVDSAARKEGRSRSGTIDAWLRSAARLEAERSLEDEIAAYYDGLTEAEAAEDAEWARLSTASFVTREGRAAAGSRPRRRGR